MSLVYKHGDILTPNTSDRGVVVCHQVNCKGVMGAGLAKQVRMKHPHVYESYKKKCDAGYAHLGDVQYVSCLDSDKYIIANIFGQIGFGRDKQYTSYGALERACENLLDTFPDDIIRIPYGMGCGLGGGKWDMVLLIIERHLSFIADVEIWQL